MVTLTLSEVTFKWGDDTLLSYIFGLALLCCEPSCDFCDVSHVSTSNFRGELFVDLVINCSLIILISFSFSFQFSFTSNFRFSVQYVLSGPSEKWTGLKGRVDKDMLKEFSTSDWSAVSNQQSPVIQRVEALSGLDQLFAICGPDEFTATVKR